MNSTQLLLLGLLVWFAMSNKSKDTRNVLLVVAGILFFCMMNVKEGFTLDRAHLMSIFNGGAEGEGADDQATYTVGDVVFSGPGPWDITGPENNNISCADPQKILNQSDGASARSQPDDRAGNISDFFTCAEAPQECTDNVCEGTRVLMDTPPSTGPFTDATCCTAAPQRCTLSQETLDSLPENTNLNSTTCDLTQTAGEMWSQGDECEVVCKEDFTRSPTEGAPTVHLRCDSDGKLGLTPAATDVKCCRDTWEEPDGEGGCADSTLFRVLVGVGALCLLLVVGVCVRAGISAVGKKGAPIAP